MSHDYNFNYYLEQREENPYTFYFADCPKELQNNREFALEFIGIGDEFAFRQLPYHYRHDRKFVIDMIKKYQPSYNILAEIPKEFLNDRNFVLDALQEGADPKMLKLVNKHFLNDEEIILAAIQSASDKYAKSGIKYASDKLLADKSFILKAVKTYNKEFRYIPQNFYSDKEIVMEAMSGACNEPLLKYVSKELRDDKEVVLAAIKQNEYAIQYVSERLCGDKDVLLEASKKNKHFLKYASDKMRNDKDVVLTAVKQDWYAVTYASEKLRNDKDIILVALKGEHTKSEHEKLLKLIPKELYSDKKFILEAIKYDFPLKWVPSPLCDDKDVAMVATGKDPNSLISVASYRQDKEIVLTAVKQNGYALEHASDKLQNDKEVVLEAIRQNGCALQFASKNLQNDKGVVLEAIKQNGYALNYTPEKLKDDKEIVLEAVRQYGYALQFASKNLQNDKEVVLEAVKQDRYALQFATKKLQNDKEVAIEAIRHCKSDFFFSQVYEKNEIFHNDKDVVREAIKCEGFPYSFEHASKEIRGDRDTALAALKHCRQQKNPVKDLLEYVEKNLFDDKNFVVEGIKNEYFGPFYASERLRNDKDIIAMAIKQDGSELKYASEKLKNDKEIVLEAVRQDGRALQFASKNLQNDKEVVLEAIKHGGTLQYASKELQNDKDIVKEYIQIYNTRKSIFSKEFFPKESLADPEVALIALQSRIISVNDIPAIHYDNKEIMLEAMNRSADSFWYSSENLRNDKEFMLKAISRSHDLIKYAPENLLCDKDFVLKTLSYSSLEYAPEEFRSDKEFMLVAIKQDAETFNDASEKLLADKDFMAEVIPEIARYRPMTLQNCYDLDIDVYINCVKENPDTINYIPLEALQEIVLRFREDIIAKTFIDKEMLKKEIDKLMDKANKYSSSSKNAGESYALMAGLLLEMYEQKNITVDEAKEIIRNNIEHGEYLEREETKFLYDVIDRVSSNKEQTKQNTIQNHE